MDPYVVFDCQRVLPNRFALTLAAAARSRALRRGSGPRLDKDDAGVSDLALHEIAAGVFTPRELQPFLPVTDGKRLLAPHVPGSRLCGGGSPGAAATPASPPGETVH